MTFGMYLVGLLSIVSLIFLSFAYAYRELQKSLLGQLIDEGALDAFTVLSLKYLTVAMRPDDHTDEERNVLYAQMKNTAEKVRPAYEAARKGDKYTVYSAVCVILLVAAAIAVGFGL